MDTALHGERIRIEHIPLAQVVLWDRNPKAHDIGNITESIRRYGFQDPPKFDAALEALVYGNGRSHCLRMMQKAKEDVPRGILVDDAGAWYVPVKFGLDLDSKRTAEAFAIDHNNLTMAGNFEVWETAKIWDEESYAALLEEMANEDVFAVTVDGDDLDALLREFRDDEPPEDPGVQIDKAEELNETWQVKAGDLWEIPSQATPGKSHRLLCGDSTKAEDVERLMGGEKADAVVTDPPFAITGSATGADDMSGLNIIAPFFRLWMRECFSRLSMFSHVYVCCDWRTYSLVDVEGKKHGVVPKNCIVWRKPDGGLGAMYQNAHEFIWFATKQESARVRCNKTGHRMITGQTNVWEYTPPTYSTGKDRSAHTANKPIEMFERMIENSTDPGAVVIDPFLGSGTTAVAAERTARICYGMEIEPKYCAVALERMAGMGLEPRLVSDG